MSLDGAIVAILDEGELCFKADAETDAGGEAGAVTPEIIAVAARSRLPHASPD